MTDTFTSGIASLTKFVRNVTIPVVGTNPFVYNATTYYQSGVTAKPGDTLEYILVASNSGTSPVTASVITDVLPTAYVALKLAAYGASGQDIKYVSDTSAVSLLTAVSDADQAAYTGGSSTLTVNIGTGATNSAGGSIPAAKAEFVLYQVTIN
jgi:uncharacterized repeat protein (TIGR01451 family)